MSPLNIEERPQSAAAAPVLQYLTFTLGEETYGVEILGVQEIKGYSGVTPLPNTPAYIRGMMNLRGTVIPVLDLRIRFAMTQEEYSKFTVVIVVRVSDKVIGLIVDAVSDVVDIATDAIRETPEIGMRGDNRFIAGIAHVNEKLIVLLDASRLLTEEEHRVIN